MALADHVDGLLMAAAAPRSASVTFDVEGMTCAGCAARVDRALRATPGVVDVSVNLALERATVAGAATADVLAAAVARAGYRARPRLADARSRREAEARRAAARRDEDRRTLALTILAGVLTLPLLAQMLLMPLGVALSPWAQLALATPVQLVAGARFYRGAWASLRSGTGNMDVLVALGTSAAFAYSAARVLLEGAHAHESLYFEASAVVITLVLAGKLLEARAKRGTTAALRALMDLRPESARVARDGREIDVPVEEVAAGERVVLRPGERVPVDGLVVEGLSEVDEAVVTGESLPVARRPGDRVLTGAINGSGRLVLQAVAVGEDTMLARVSRLIEAAQAGRAPIQRLVDRVSAVFVPVVVALAAATFLGWMLLGPGFEPALVAAVSVLVIACPCALGLATPAALVAGTGAAARAGILIKDIDALERAHGIDTVIFDKTGTLTEGRPVVTEIVAPGGEEEVLRLAASLQAASEHPLARAVVDRASGLALSPVSRFESRPGEGVMGTVDDQRVAVGNAALIEALGLAPGALAGQVSRLEQAGRTAVFVAVDGEVAAVLAIADAVRPTSREAVATLAARGIATRLLSGDALAVARAVAAETGIESVRAPVRPLDKAGEVEALRAQGRSVAMVGDGVNDAPALAAADLGIAMGTGTDVALESAGVALLRPDPRLVAAALDIARATRAKIRQNLFWAFAYNVIGLPLAAFGLLSPALAGAAMALSSVSVVANALLLRRWRPALG